MTTTEQPHRNEPRLAGKVAIVTGGGSHEGQVGTGRATAVCMAKEGARVLIADVAEENAARTATAIRDVGGEASVFTGDATQSEDSRALIAAAVERYGRLDVLVNNLGFGGMTHRDRGLGKGVSEIDEDEWQRAFDINLKTAMLASKFAIPAMIQSGGGSIINLSSCDALAAATHCEAPYSVSKGALHLLTKGTAAWHGRQGIRANCIAVGHLYSAFQFADTPEERVRRRRVSPLGTEGTPWDVAWAAVFLASDEARWISGATLPVDGGLLAAQPLFAHDLIEGVSPFDPGE